MHGDARVTVPKGQVVWCKLGCCGKGCKERVSHARTVGLLGHCGAESPPGADGL